MNVDKEEEEDDDDDVLTLDSINSCNIQSSKILVHQEHAKISIFAGYSSSRNQDSRVDNMGQKWEPKLYL